MNDLKMIRNIVARFAADSNPNKEVYEAIEKAKAHDLVMGMSAAAKKAKERFGMRDAKEAMEAWFDNGREPKTPAQRAAREYLESDAGTKTLNRVTKAVEGALKKKGGPVGYRDIGKVIVAWFGE